MLATILTLALAASVPDTTRVVLVATTDVHGHATDWDYYADRPFPGGLARAATVVDSLRARYPGQVVVVDAGDLLQGEPFATHFAQVAPRDPHPVIEAMGLIGYDAATPGNHDFNFGLPFLRSATASAAFPYVSGNIYGLPADSLLYPAYTVLRRGAVRIAIAGFTTPGVMLWDRAHVRGRARVGPIGASAPAVLREMRRDADVAVVLIHSGMAEPASYDTTGVGDENVAASLARLPARPDVVVVGHSHREMRDSVIGGVHFVQPKPYAQSLSVVHLTLVSEGRGWRLARVRAELVPLAAVPASPRVTARLAGQHEAVRGWIQSAIGEATAPMRATFARTEPTPVMNLIHAVQRKRTGAELSAVAAFDTRAGFDAGPITIAEVAALYPYENTLRAVRVSGDQLRRYLEHSARYYRVDSAGRVTLDPRVPGYNFDMIAGAEYDIDLRHPVGSRVWDLRVRGRPVQATDSFTLAVNSYRQAGGGGYDMLAGAPVVYDRGESVRELLIGAVREARRLDPAAYAERNWRLMPDIAAGAARALFGGPPPLATLGPPKDTVLLRILAIGDFHGALAPQTPHWSRGRPVGGAAVLKALMDSAEARCGCPTLRVDAGDQMQGSLASNLAFGRPAVAALNALGIRAAAIGNHDFDWSLDTLKQRMSEARYPWLAANIFDSATGQRPAWAIPWRMIEVGPRRVAVIGWITPETPSVVKPGSVRGLVFRAGPEPVREAIAEARRLQPDAVILVAHAGAVCDSTACAGEIIDLAHALGPGSVDLIVAGHTHRRVDVTVAGIPIVEAWSNGTAYAVADLVWLANGAREVRTRIEETYADSVTPDPTVAALVAEAAARVETRAARVVATAKVPVPRGGAEHPLGRLIADAQRNVTRADLAIVNDGGIRAPLPAGPVTYERLFEVHPFENRIVLLTVTGAVFQRAVEHALADGAPDAHIAGATVRYDPTAPAGRRVREIRLEGGRRMRDDGRYRLAVNDFMAGGGDGYAMFADLPAERTEYLDIETLELYLKRLPQPFVAPDRPRFVATR